MHTNIHQVNHVSIAEITGEGVLIRNVQDSLDIMADLYYQDISHIVVYEENITPDFFDLKTKLAGDILQKFSNYRVRLAVVGNFAKYTKQSMIDFIYESNKQGLINFVPDLATALEKFSRTK